MHIGTIILIVLSLTISSLTVIHQEPVFPIWPLLTYWSDAEGHKELEVLGTETEKIININNNNAKGGIVRVWAGKTLNLRCHPMSHHSAHRQYQWHFLPCGPGYNQQSCKILRSSLTIDTEWQVVQSQSQLDELILDTPAEEDSGLYKCSTIRNDGTLKVLRMFQLEIIDGTVHAPNIVEGPFNVSVAYYGRDQKISLQCRVTSSVQPNIVWFRKLNTAPSTREEDVIIYRDAGWKMLPSNQIHLGNQLYLSKLSFDQLSLDDSGYYACIAINYKGWTMQEAQLKVYLPFSPSSVNNTGKVEQWVGFKFSSLFLIPACLALVPASAWLCYLYHKPRNKQNVPFVN
ncbi:fibroblast growth factor receptor-like 1 [Diprion similis]|uniref:fibroblast growth factor receptor-like 1 n=1 Tax=Diprion similis TaxID=362088 RepID=UPI001EF7672C|nr:fibroblast growth factor receptor-like 1 [Diprion similis]XP_046751255.1 fibroblast growth factor receptor-like 1 [Diprion similis]